MGCGGSWRRATVSLGARGIQRRNCGLFCRRPRASPAGQRGCRGRVRRHRIAVAAEKAISRCCHDRRCRGGLRDGDMANPADRATSCWRSRSYSVPASGFVEARDIRERTDRFVLRVTQMEAPRTRTQTRAGSAVGAKGRRTGGGQLCRIEGAAAAAARAVAARQLRFCPRHVLPGHRRLRFCDRHHPECGAAVPRRLGVALCRSSCRDCAMPSTRASEPRSMATGAPSHRPC